MEVSSTNEMSHVAVGEKQLEQLGKEKQTGQSWLKTNKRTNKIEKKCWANIRRLKQTREQDFRKKA